MGVLEGVIPLINALAWPIATVVLAVLFQREIKQAAGRLGQLKFRELEVNFREDLRQAEALALSIPAAPKASAATPGRVLLEADEASGPTLSGTMIVAGGMAPDRESRREGGGRRVVRLPREEILAAWSELGETLVRVANSAGDRKLPALARAEDAARLLMERGSMIGDEARLFEILRQLRERADRHDGLGIGPEEARRFVDLAARLRARMAVRG